MLQIGDVYSDAEFGKIAEAYTKAAWQRGVWNETRWMGVPVQQMPEDLFTVAALIHRDEPDIVIETGVLFGGSILFYASLLRALGKGRIIGVDVTLQNCAMIRSHALSDTFELVEGDSASPETLGRVREQIPHGSTVLVILDSDHSRAHVAAELEAYSPLVSPGSHLVVFDGVMKILHDAPQGSSGWKEDNPFAATRDFLSRHPEFEVDHSVPSLGITFAPDGILRREGAKRRRQKTPAQSRGTI